MKNPPNSSDSSPSAGGTSSRPLGPTSSTTSPGGGGNRLLVGCLAGCGCLFLVGIGLVAGLVFWSIVPGEQIPSKGIVGEGSIGSARVERIAEDEGVSEFLLASLVEWMEAGQRLQREQMPEELQWLSFLQGSPEGELKDLKKVLPRDATLILEPPVLLDDGRVDRVPWIAAVNVNRYPRLIRFFTRRFFGVIDDPSHERIRHRGVVVDEFEGGFAAGFVDSTLLVAGRAEDVVLGIDRLLDGTGGVEVAKELGELPSELGEWDFESAVLNQDGVFDSWIADAFFGQPSPGDLFEEEGLFEDGSTEIEGMDSGEVSFQQTPLPQGGIARVALRLDIETRDTARARLDLTLQPGSDVDDWRAALERSSRHWFADQQRRGLDVDVLVASPSDGRSDPTSENALSVEIEMSGLIAVMQSLVESTLMVGDDWQPDHDSRDHESRDNEP